MKTINIRGKEYIEVSERLKHFRANYKDHSLVSEVIEKTDLSIMIKATVIDDKGVVRGTGHAEEEKDSSRINSTNYVENCETSAWGRALANFGIGLDTSVASADEVKNALSNKKKPMQKETSNGLKKLAKTDANFKKVKSWIENNPQFSFEQVMTQLAQGYTKESLNSKAVSTEIDRLVTLNKNKK